MSMISRRAILRGSCAACCTPLLPRLALAEPALGPAGCCQDRLGAAVVADNPGGLASSAGPAFYNSSGNPEMDRFLGRALVRLATSFKVQPGFAFDADRHAYATPDTLLPGTWGTVVMGRERFAELIHYPDRGMTVIAVSAHEFGHIHQMRYGYQERLARLDRTHRPIELHADFLAGYFVALRKQEHPEFDLQSVGAHFYQIGDTAFSHRDHHGTPQERVAAITAGYNFGRSGNRDIMEAAQAGTEQVARLL
jgi:hypothetical protein